MAMMRQGYLLLIISLFTSHSTHALQTRTHFTRSITSPCHSSKSLYQRQDGLPIKSSQLILWMASSSSSEDDKAIILSEEGSPHSKKQRLTKAYNLSTGLFGVASLILFGIPDRTLTKKLATKWGGAAGFGLAAYWSHVLSKATQKDRLSSDTYKRGNLGLFGFSVLGLAALPGEAGFWPHATPAIATSAILTIVRIVGAVVSIWGWKVGILKGVSPIQELWNGCKNNLRGLRVQEKKKSLFYRNALLIVLFSMFSSVMEWNFQLRYKDALTNISSFVISLQWSAVSRLFFISSLLYSLKDAAERDRLSETTFVHANYMIAVWAFIVGVGQAIGPKGFSLRKMEMFAFSVLFVLKGYKGQKGIIWVKQTEADDEESKGDDEKEEESSEDTDES